MITADDAFVVFTIAAPKADVDKAKKEKKKPEEQPKPGLGIYNLATGELFTANRVKSFKVPEESGKVVAYLLEAPEKKADAAAEKKEGEAKPEAKPEPRAEAKPAADATKKPKEKKKDPGTELIVRDLATGTQASIAEVGRLRLGEGRQLARLWNRIPGEDAREGRRVRPPHERRRDEDAARRPRALQGFRLR